MWGELLGWVERMLSESVGQCKAPGLPLHSGGQLGQLRGRGASGLCLAFQIEGFSCWGRSNKNCYGFYIVHYLLPQALLPANWSAEKAVHP